MTMIQEVLQQMVQHCYKYCSQLYYVIQHVELISIEVIQLKKNMHKLTQIGGHRDWLHDSAKLKSTGLCPNTRYFTIYQLSYFGLT